MVTGSGNFVPQPALAGKVHCVQPRLHVGPVKLCEPTHRLPQLLPRLIPDRLGKIQDLVLWAPRQMLAIFLSRKGEKRY